MWIETTYRYVAFFDILGFKDMVFRNNHDSIKKKLLLLSNIVTQYKTQLRKLKRISRETPLVKIGLFSDSLVIFSSDNSPLSLEHTLLASHYILALALNNKIPIKGAISYGKVTADFNKSIFFGKALIDAYLLQDELLLYGAILHHSVERKINSIKENEAIKNYYIDYTCPLKLGNVNHLLINYHLTYFLHRIKQNKGIVDFKEISSGHQRKYVDNTLKYFEFLQKKFADDFKYPADLIQRSK